MVMIENEIIAKLRTKKGLEVEYCRVVNIVSFIEANLNF